MCGALCHAGAAEYVRERPWEGILHANLLRFSRPLYLNLDRIAARCASAHICLSHTQDVSDALYHTHVLNVSSTQPPMLHGGSPPVMKVADKMRRGFNAVRTPDTLLFAQTATNLFPRKILVDTLTGEQYTGAAAPGCRKW